MHKSRHHYKRGFAFAGRRHAPTGTSPLLGIHAAIDLGYRLVGAAHGWDLHSLNWPSETHAAPAASSRD